MSVCRKDRLGEGGVDEDEKEKDLHKDGEHGGDVGDAVSEERHAPGGAGVEMEDL